MPDPRRALDAALVETLAARTLDLADESRRLILTAVRAGFSVERKPDQSFLTSVDVAVEGRLRALIGEFFPGHGVIGEEHPDTNSGAEFRWILDPIDGTEEFAHGIPTYGTIIGLHWRGLPVAGALDFPALDLRVHAAFGSGCFRNGARVTLGDEPGIDTRKLRVHLSARANFTRYHDDGALFDRLAHSFPNHRVYRSCLGHALAATGAVDAAVDWHNRLWDLAATQILVEEAGGSYRPVRALTLDGGGEIFSAVFGRRTAVEHITPLLG